MTTRFTHKQMPALIRKAKKVYVWVQIGENTSTHIVARKGDLLETFTQIANANTSWPDSFICLVDENGSLFIQGAV